MTILLQRIGASSRTANFKTLARCVTNSASKEILGPAGTPKPSAAIPYQEADENTPKELWQAPNHPGTWSRGQNPKPHAMSGPRFEQRDLRFQAAPFAGITAVAEDPIRLVDGRRATCDGGGGPLGHPKIFINLDKPGPKPCGYCGIRFEQAHHEH
ncbi:hypothetical protein QFC20_003454 [Naganishia adeliensis]|uniref:Uncharacterized protein n=1 Tax=Naganishia adeliensis TaxID=92952 RepID=A0ACC2W961_9TREE|nr:hypothetical protein QFC20_003454 [Naganishia adeliensis]